MATGDNRVLYIVLGSVGLFLLLVFVFLVACFTWRRHSKRSRRGKDISELAQRQLILNRMGNSSSKGESVHASKVDLRPALSGRDAGAAAVTGSGSPADRRWSRGTASARVPTDDDNDNDDDDYHFGATEWGATVREDGTRSYLNGW